MPFTEIPTHNKIGALAPTGASISASGVSTRFATRLTVVLRPTLIGPGLDWLHPGATFRLLIGSGDDAGLLRIERAPSGRKFGTVGGCGDKYPRFLLQGPDWIPSRKHPSEFIETDHGVGWVDLTLPDWARPAPVIVSPPVVAERVRSTFTMTDHLPDPVSAGRRGQTAIGGRA